MEYTLYSIAHSRHSQDLQLFLKIALLIKNFGNCFDINLNQVTLFHYVLAKKLCE